MSIAPSSGQGIIVEGEFSFSAQSQNGHKNISDSYNIRIEVPEEFPRRLPIVKELGGKINKDGGHHVNDNGTLCLGSPLRLLKILSDTPNLVNFAEHCLVPFLYGASCKISEIGVFPFGELDHGPKGVVRDYMELFKLDTPHQAAEVIKLLGMKKRIANKERCPCGCGRRLGKCAFNEKLSKYRNLASRSWFKSQAGI